ncbi:hypothetical protein PGTUg99_018623 [Puccinia graminis f. sp. tritici]|uniref:Uncharacterized protein n=1 Tax=Puccinia graminis f. sp. tritici TaxID=56615 RepID=A0A5B0R5J9_PUCGR|nr:hypothetical protein PGTUg99_018623 [Puccinia graminis f. sp. tritici]
MIVINDHGRYFGGAQLMTGPHDGVWEATSYRISYDGNGQRDIFSAKSKILGPPPKFCVISAASVLSSPSGRLGFPLQQLHITPQLHTTPSDRHHAPPPHPPKPPFRSSTSEGAMRKSNFKIKKNQL